MMARWLWLSIAAAGMAAAQTQAGPALAVDATAARLPISPDIYGVNDYFVEENVAGSTFEPDLTAASAGGDLRVGVRRWGGDNASRYNWKLDVWNSANDYYFEVAPDLFNPNPAALPNGSRADLMLEYARVTGSKLLAGVSMLGWLPNVRPASWAQEACSFPVSAYGTQAQTDPYDHNCGNGVRPDNKTLIANNVTDIASLFDESYQAEWVQHMVANFGQANQGGVAIWQLDNEPVWWPTTHRDIHPLPQTYEETWGLSRTYAQAIKQADPTALVMSPGQPIWAGMFYSSLDFAGAGLSVSEFAYLPVAQPLPAAFTYPNISYWANPIDRNVHGGVDFTSWYLQKFQAYEQQTGQRLLDYLDEHFYGMQLQPATNADRLLLTHILWDPNYAASDTFWTQDDQGQPAKPCIIPRMHDWVNQNYPGTRIALTEYDFGAHGSIVGGLAEADALGIFGREGVDLAAAWVWGTPDAPGDTAPVSLAEPFAFAFRMYRNYDGIGGAFGETSVQAATGDTDQLSIFAAQRSDNALTIMVLNKTTGDLSSTVAISDFNAQGTAQVWQYSGANLSAIVRQPDLTVANGSISAVFPAYSMTMLVVTAAQAGPKPVVTAVTNAASYQSQVAPGQMVVVWGTNLGPAQLDNQIVVGKNGIVSNVMDGVSILFDGVPAPLVYVSAQQCSAVVPYLAALKRVVNVQVEYQGVRSDPFQVNVGATAPALFTVNSQGTGQGAIQNEDGVTPNSIDAPAAPGSVVILWGTGEGVTVPPGVDGRLAINILPSPAAQCAAEIGGLPATIEYCGAAPYQMPGLFQVNARMDPTVAPGNAVQVSVIVGGEASQGEVTMVVR